MTQPYAFGQVLPYRRDALAGVPVTGRTKRDMHASKAAAALFTVCDDDYVQVSARLTAPPIDDELGA
jgi:hypothetical protein